MLVCVTFNKLQGFCEGTLPAFDLRDECFITSYTIPFEDDVGPQARIEILQSTMFAAHQLIK